MCCFDTSLSRQLIFSFELAVDNCWTAKPCTSVPPVGNSCRARGSWSPTRSCGLWLVERARVRDLIRNRFAYWLIEAYYRRYCCDVQRVSWFHQITFGSRIQNHLERRVLKPIRKRCALCGSWVPVSGRRMRQLLESIAQIDPDRAADCVVPPCWKNLGYTVTLTRLHDVAQTSTKY